MSSTLATAAAPSVGLARLLRHNQEKTSHASTFCAAQPQPLDVKWQGGARAKIVYGGFPFLPPDALCGTGDNEGERFRAARASLPDGNGQLKLASAERNGRRAAGRRKMMWHALFHSMRQWAQLTTVQRQADDKQDWPHDFVFAEVME